MTSRLLTYTMLILAAVSCSRKAEPVPDGSISFPVETKALFSAPAGSIPSTILVASDAEYNDIEASGLVSPIFQLDVTDIFQWEGRMYNTLEKYPVGNTLIHIFGYAPNDLLTTDDNWATLNPAYPGGTYDNAIWEDILVAGPVAGRHSAPVSDPLVYQHPVSRFTFTAAKDVNIGNYKVRDVTIIAGEEIVPHSLRWDATKGLWAPAGKAGNTLQIDFRNKETGATELGEITESPFYLIPQADDTIGPFTIRVKYYVTEPAYAEDIFEKTNLFFQISTKDGEGIRGGHDYTVNIRFKQDSFVIYGICQDDWEDGGNIIIPIINETTLL